jgi:hypothetical protein
MGEAERMHNHDLEKQNDPWDIDGFSYAPADVCNSQRRGSARRAIGSVPGDGWGVGDLRFAVREIEIVSSVEVKQRPKVAVHSGPRVSELVGLKWEDVHDEEGAEAITVDEPCCRGDWSVIYAWHVPTIQRRAVTKTIEMVRSRQDKNTFH